MEIRIDISHSENPQDMAGSAYFMFVARDATDYSKAIELPELSFEGEKDAKKCALRNEYGKKNKSKKKLFSEVCVHILIVFKYLEIFIQSATQFRRKC